MRIYSIIFGLLLILWTGCASVESTADYYIPSTTQIFPPKPKDFPIPIINSKPKQPTKSIGRLAFTSTEGFPFMRKSMEYNARRVGADVVLLKQANSEAVSTPYYVPPRTDWAPISTYSDYRYRNKHGKKRYGTYETTNYIPIFQPGYWTQDTRVYTTIDAEMLVYKK